jgi:ribosome-binding factor A
MKKNDQNSNRGDRIASTVQKYADQILRTQYTDDKILTGVSIVGAQSGGGVQVVRLFYYAGLARVAGFSLDAVQRRLDGVKSQIRSALAHLMNQKHVPDIRFVYDDTLERAERVEALLKNS